jgi:hypothetical protein
MAQLALLCALLVLTLMAAWGAVRMQRQWAVDGEIRDPMKRKWMRVMIYTAASLGIFTFLQVFLFFNPPPPRISGTSPSQTQR